MDTNTRIFMHIAEKITVSKNFDKGTNEARRDIGIEFKDGSRAEICVYGEKQKEVKLETTIDKGDKLSFAESTALRVKTADPTEAGKFMDTGGYKWQSEYDPIGLDELKFILATLRAETRELEEYILKIEKEER